MIKETTEMKIWGLELQLEEVKSMLPHYAGVLMEARKKHPEDRTEYEVSYEKEASSLYHQCAVSIDVLQRRINEIKFMNGITDEIES